MENLSTQERSNRLLKTKLEIKRQMKYCQRQLDHAISRGNKNSDWDTMIQTYQIVLDIIEGKDL